MGSQQSQPSKDHDLPPQLQKQPQPDTATRVSNQTLATHIPQSALATNGASITTTRPSRFSSQPLKPSQTPSQVQSSTPSTISGSSLSSTLNFGLASSAGGLLFGAVTGILRSSHPVIFTITSGIQWGLAGTTFHGIRSLASNPSIVGEIAETKEGRITGTAIAGVAAGGVAGAVKGMRRIMPFALVGGVGGLGGQWVREWRDRNGEDEEESQEPKTWVQRIGRSSWSPMKLLTDEEYADMLRTKLLKVEAEIAVLEDDIKRLKKTENGKDDKQ